MCLKLLYLVSEDDIESCFHFHLVSHHAKTLDAQHIGGVQQLVGPYNGSGRADYLPSISYYVDAASDKRDTRRYIKYTLRSPVPSYD